MKAITVSFSASFMALFWVILFLALPQPFPELAAIFLGSLITVAVIFAAVTVLVLALRLLTEAIARMACLLGYQRDI